MKFSYSQYNTFSKCSRYWYNNYQLKLEGKESGASLFFGSAVDASIMALLEGKSDWRDIFERNFTTARINNKYEKVFDNEGISYSHGDFDEDVLQPQDLLLMESWAKELGLDNLAANPVAIYKECSKIKKNPFKVTTPEILKYFNRCSWITLLRKGVILIDSFHTQFYPRIEKVVYTQKHLFVKDEASGDSIQGVLDMAVKLKGEDSVYILDLKTAASPYSESQVKTSSQLTLYAALMASEIPLPSKIGYVVLCKQIPKDTVKTCSACGNISSGRHKTCEKEINGVRCNSAWIEKTVLKPEVQFIFDSRTQEQVNDLLIDFSNMITIAKNNLVYRNTELCDSYYGAPCVYKKLCWESCKDGLKTKGT